MEPGTRGGGGEYDIQVWYISENEHEPLSNLTLLHKLKSQYTTCIALLHFTASNISHKAHTRSFCVAYFLSYISWVTLTYLDPIVYLH